MWSCATDDVRNRLPLTIFCPLALQTELLDGNTSLLQEKVSVLSEQLDRYKAAELEQQQETERLLSSQKSLFESHLAQEQRSSEEARHKIAQECSQKISQEHSRKMQEADESREKETKRLERLLDEERGSREEEAVRMSGLLEEERVAREEEASRYGMHTNIYRYLYTRSI